MAVTTGNDGVITTDGNTVASLRGWTMNREKTRIDKTVMGDTDRSSLGGFGDGSGTLTVAWDETDTLGQEALQTAAENGTTVSLVLYPKGNSAGLPRLTVANAVILGSSEEGRMEELLERTFNWAKQSGSIVEDTVP